MVTVNGAVAGFVTGVGRLFSGRVVGPEGLTAADIAYALREVQTTDTTDQWYTLYQDYYLGHQANPLTLYGNGPHDAEAHPTTARTYQGAHNLCELVVDALVERLDITGVEVLGLPEPANDRGEDAPPTEAERLAEQVWQWWQAWDGPELQNAVHTQALVAGDTYLNLTWDAERGEPVASWESALSIAPVYKTIRGRRTLVRAYKTWTETFIDDAGRQQERQRVIKYEPDRITKYYRVGLGAWLLWIEDLGPDGQPDGGVLDWTDRRGQPLGIPLVHFKNKARGHDCGRSELASLIGPQDELNRRIRYTSEGISFSGLPINILLNANTRDAQGNEIDFAAAPGEVWTLAPQVGDKPVDVKQLSAGNTAQLEASVNAQAKFLLGIGGTPWHQFTQEGQVPSGEALKTAEARLTARAADRITTFTPAWGEVFAIAARLAAAFGGLRLPEGVTFQPQWASVHTRDETAAADRAVKLDPVIASGSREALRVAGFTDEDIERILREREEDREAMPEPAAVAPVVGQAPPPTERQTDATPPAA